MDTFEMLCFWAFFQIIAFLFANGLWRNFRQDRQAALAFLLGTIGSQIAGLFFVGLAALPMDSNGNIATPHWLDLTIPCGFGLIGLACLVKAYHTRSFWSIAVCISLYVGISLLPRGSGTYESLRHVLIFFPIVAGGSLASVWQKKKVNL